MKTKRLIFLFFSIIIQVSASAGFGQIIVLSAPMLKYPDWDSKVMYELRNGDKVYIHDKHFGVPTADHAFTQSDEAAQAVQDENDLLEFFETTDKSGRTAYIPAKYIKLIYNDFREMKYGVRPVPFDPTDYRLIEPIADDFPFYHANKIRTIFSFHYGPSYKVNYPHTFPIYEEEFSDSMGFSLQYLKKVSFDKDNNVFFGGSFQFHFQQSQFELTNLNTSWEDLWQLSIGPYISYDSYNSLHHRITIAGSISLNFWIMYVSIGTEDSFETRQYIEWTLTPKISSYWQWKKVFNDIDFILGAEFQFAHNATLDATDSASRASYWQDTTVNDAVELPFGGMITFVLGVQSTFP